MANDDPTTQQQSQEQQQNSKNLPQPCGEPGETSCRSFKNHEEIKSCSPSNIYIESLVAVLYNFVEEDPQKQKELNSICCALRKLNLLPQAPSDIIKWSRYMLEFEEIYHVADGGFGSVFQARHRLDKNVYAVKKICLNAEEIKENITEVIALAKLNHPNIVAYKTAWIEPMKIEKNNLRSIQSSKCSSNKSKSKSSSDSTAFEKSQKNDEEDEAFNSSNSPSKYSSNKSKSKSSSDWIVFEKSQKNDEDDETSNSSNSPSENAMCRYEHKICEKYKNDEDDKTFNSSNSPSELDNAMCRYEHKICEKYTSATLYIQMQFCEQTLRRWLDLRNTTLDFTVCTDIFKKVVKGVEYIHSQGIVHHDINPNNIFVSEDLREVQVGDFGLACCILAHQSQSIAASTHRKGTYPYAAPEQLMGTCNPKSDIYSLGVVLHELFFPFKTTMELIEMLKSGKIPIPLIAEFPKWAKIIRQLVDIVDKRPTALELLSELIEESTNECSERNDINNYINNNFNNDINNDDINNNLNYNNLSNNNQN